MDLLQRFKKFIQQEDLFHQKDKLLLAVSGGVDSVVLCELCKRSGYNFSIAHCNFQLRGAESERDEIFVRNLGKKYDVEVLVKKFETGKYADENKIGIQEAARDLRYAWFNEILKEWSGAEGRKEPKIPQPGAFILLTAHHADDNIETVMMNFFRGTGLNGLAGIPTRTPNIRRPLLGFWKEELIQFASENKLEFVEDSSNESSKYTRNFFRNEIIPLVSESFPEVKSNVLDNIKRFKEIQKLYNFSITALKKKICKAKNDEIHIPVKQLMGFQSRALIFEIISEYGFAEKQVDEVIKLAESESGKFIQSPGTNNRIIKFRNWLIISKGRSEDAKTIVIEKEENSGQFSIPVAKGSNLHFSVVPGSNIKLPASNTVACLDADEVVFPLMLRDWKQGDYFYPLGMKKKKKLSRFFIDQKLSKTDREKIRVIEMNKKIVWVVGIRIDDRFKITDKTKSILKISLEGS